MCILPHLFHHRNHTDVNDVLQESQDPGLLVLACDRHFHAAAAPCVRILARSLAQSLINTVTRDLAEAETHRGCQWRNGSLVWGWEEGMSLWRVWRVKRSTNCHNFEQAHPLC
jgi:hypothetical protein